MTLPSRAAARALLPFAVAALLAACAEAPPRPSGVVVNERPAEKALLTGIRAYDDAQYLDAEKALKKALESGLASARDRATANKLLAFIYCTSERVSACEQAFRSARQSDPQFTLSKSEAGHPLWGPVYRKVATP
jgi:Tfp pilus assembly protein PilF